MKASRTLARSHRFEEHGLPFMLWEGRRGFGDKGVLVDVSALTARAIRTACEARVSLRRIRRQKGVIVPAFLRAARFSGLAGR